jgi:hypothetical protein
MIQCRICLEENLERNDVIVPCKCSGTQKYVHKRCLNEWRTINRNNRLYHKCQLCNTEYSLMIIGGLNYVPAYEGNYQIVENKYLCYRYFSSILYYSFCNPIISMFIIQIICSCMGYIEPNPQIIHFFKKINKHYSEVMEKHIYYLLSILVIEVFFILLYFIDVFRLCKLYDYTQMFIMNHQTNMSLLMITISLICFSIYSPILSSILFSVAYSSLLITHRDVIIQMNKDLYLNGIIDIEDVDNDLEQPLLYQ